MSTDYYCNNLINSFTKLIFNASYRFCRLILEFLVRNRLKYRYLLKSHSCKIVTSGYWADFGRFGSANV